MPERRKWLVLGKRGQAGSLPEALDIASPVADLLCARGYPDYDHALRFLNPSDSDIHDPSLLPDMDRAVARIVSALKNGEKFGVYGDYDVDGVTSAALLQRTLSCLSHSPHLVFARVPHRHLDGYGLSVDAVNIAADAGCTVLISADCGISAHEAAQQAHTRGVDLIITDHHEPGESLPDALAVINPKRLDSQYPFRELAGVGVAFKLGEAVCKALGHDVASYRSHYLDLVALGTVADSASLVDENRAFVSLGLPLLVETRKKGLQLLISSVRRPMSTSAISYQIGPRLNAVGRIADAAQALELLTTYDPVRAGELVTLLERLNIERRSEQDRVQAEALAYIVEQGLERDRVLLVAGKDWHKGVVGIVAGRLAEDFHRPAFVVSGDDHVARGSARSAGNFSVIAALTSCREYLLDFGGHSQAAGFDAVAESLAELRAGLNEYAETVLTDEDVAPTMEIDLELSAEEISSRLLKDIARLGPFGSGNTEPVWLCRGMLVKDNQEFRGNNGQGHLRLALSADGISTLEAIWWRQAARRDEFASGLRVDVVFSLESGAGYGSEYRMRLHDVTLSDNPPPLRFA